MTPARVLAAMLCALSVPVAQAQSVRPPQGPPGSVTLSLAEYNRLLDRAERPTKLAELPPIPAVLARADVTVRVADTRARGVYTLDGEVFTPFATRVPLVRDATILSATRGTAPLPLQFDGGITYAILPGAAPFSIVLEWGSSLEFAPGRTILMMPVPEAGSASATFELPGAASDVTVEPGAVTRVATTGNVTRVEATLIPGRAARVTWSSRQSGAPRPSDLRFTADVKSLISIGESDVRMSALIDVMVVRGQTARLDCRLPAGYAVTSVTGRGVGKTDERDGVLTVTLEDVAERTHRVLVMLERSAAPGTRLETPVLTVLGAERETGEVGVEATGTVDLVAHDNDVLHRIDVREANASLRALAQTPMLAMLRYHRRGNDAPIVALDVTRYPDAAIVAAVAERAVATTLVTSDGRTLTEVSLTLRNRAQPFLRVDLPAGATIVSAEVAGEAAKVAQAADGVRVPLFRPGFRPAGAYTVSFVYMHSGQPFEKKGRTELVLPTMDVPFSLMEWELFVPDRYRVKRFDGDAMLMPALMEESESGGQSAVVIGEADYATRDQLGGTVLDSSGAPLPGATVTVAQGGRLIASVVTDPAGQYVFQGLPKGRLVLSCSLAGFKNAESSIVFHGSLRADIRLAVGALSETVQVTAQSASESDRPEKSDNRRLEQAQAPSQNVFNLQRRVAGVLPVRIDVPRAGVAYRFVRPLVFAEPTRVSFDYRRN
jgi:Carboxypeptidase regulatory-like domain